MITNLLSPFSSLNRVNKVISQSLSRLVGSDRVFDLLLHKPVRIEKILHNPKLFDVANETLIAIKVKVETHQEPKTRKQPHKIICYTPSGYLNLVFFKTFPGQMAKFQPGTDWVVVGKLQKNVSEHQIVHPRDIFSAEKISEIPQFEVIYPLSYALTQKFLRWKISEIIQTIPQNFGDWIDEKLVKQQGWDSFRSALDKLHNPQSEQDLLPHNSARQRLAYDELLAWQIAMLISRERTTPAVQKVRYTAGVVRSQEFLQSLPFQPTSAQQKAIKEISENLSSPQKMLRLLQGDVGSGKTIVAISACLQTLEKGCQSCVIAPTTILAKQHFAYFEKLLSQFDFNIALLTSDTTKKQKEKLVEKLQNGEIDILIATHAILEDDVKFKNLELAVIDEQHRFGVIQRLKLAEKGDNVNLLLMSATPIPRSLMMALYGDMDISVLNEKPKNRQEIKTVVMSEKKSSELFDSVKKSIAQGNKVYWVCPLVEESEDEELGTVGLHNVNDKFKELQKIFGEESVAILHGKMKEKEKEKIMQQFADPESAVKILVATTVIEVGIDVPDATIIIIENSENFGLAQLHQLRGRVGRSDKESFCVLLYGKRYGTKAQQRLAIMRESNDGFFIAEEDLKMRGSGELLGTKQSGFPEFKIADLSFDSDLLKIANKEAKLILNRDPELKNTGEKYQDLMRLFGYDECLKLPAGG